MRSPSAASHQPSLRQSGAFAKTERGLSVDELCRRLTQWGLVDDGNIEHGYVIGRMVRQLLGKRSAAADRLLLDMLHGKHGQAPQELMLRALISGVGNAFDSWETIPYHHVAVLKRTPFAETCFAVGNANFLRALVAEGRVCLLKQHRSYTGEMVSSWWSESHLLGCAARPCDPFELEVPTDELYSTHRVGSLVAMALAHEGPHRADALAVAAELAAEDVEWDVRARGKDAAGAAVRDLWERGCVHLSPTTVRLMSKVGRRKTGRPQPARVQARYASLREGSANRLEVAAAARHEHYLSQLVNPHLEKSAFKKALTACRDYIDQGVPCRRSGKLIFDTAPFQQWVAEALDHLLTYEWKEARAKSLRGLLEAYLAGGHFDFETPITTVSIPGFDALGRPAKPLDFIVEYGLVEAAEALIAAGDRFDDVTIGLLESSIEQTSWPPHKAILSLARQQHMQTSLDATPPSAGVVARRPRAQRHV